MIKEAILEKVEKYVIDLFESSPREPFPYHNIDHTKSVVKQAGIITTACCFSDKEKFLVLLAAWFHDTGYLFTIKNHEDKGKQIARNFLKDELSEEDLQIIDECIEATRFPQKPKNQLQFALCDADLYHLSEENFFNKSIKLWEEINLLSEKKCAIYRYWEVTLELFDNHFYHTKYGKEILSLGKARNRLLLCDKIEDCKFEGPIKS